MKRRRLRRALCRAARRLAPIAIGSAMLALAIVRRGIERRAPDGTWP